MSGFQFTLFTPPALEQKPPATGQLFSRERPSVAPSTNFIEYAKRLAPPWLSYLVGERFVGFLGLLCDLLCEGAMLSVTARSMMSRAFPEDALHLIGSERQLPRYPGESSADYFLRLWNAWSIWEQAGSDIGIVEQFAAYGAACEVVTNADWNWDNQPANWSRVWLLLRDHGLVRGPRYGDGNIYGGGQTYGSSASVGQVRAARQLARLFKPGHMRVERIVVILDDSAPLAPDGTWDLAENRSPQAIYWPG